MPSNLYLAAARCLRSDSIAGKLQLAVQLHQDLSAGRLARDGEAGAVDLVDAGRPARPELVPPNRLAIWLSIPCREML